MFTDTDSQKTEEKILAETKSSASEPRLKEKN